MTTYKRYIDYYKLPTTNASFSSSSNLGFPAPYTPMSHACILLLSRSRLRLCSRSDSSAINATSAARPPMTPPTMAPVCDVLPVLTSDWDEVSEDPEVGDIIGTSELLVIIGILDVAAASDESEVIIGIVFETDMDIGMPDPSLCTIIGGASQLRTGSSRLRIVITMASARYMCTRIQPYRRKNGVYMSSGAYRLLLHSARVGGRGRQTAPGGQGTAPSEGMRAECAEVDDRGCTATCHHYPPPRPSARPLRVYARATTSYLWLTSLLTAPPSERTRRRRRIHAAGGHDTLPLIVIAVSLVCSVHACQHQPACAPPPRNSDAYDGAPVPVPCRPSRRPGMGLVIHHQFIPHAMPGSHLVLVRRLSAAQLQLHRALRGQHLLPLLDKRDGRRDRRGRGVRGAERLRDRVPVAGRHAPRHRRLRRGGVRHGRDERRVHRAAV
ncbi:hypothetical protein CALVIDRAFT_402928 [Calocera viscosa TUFC12733]|uniref:Uncharacterized protein n=1 Tax=Calocera viscosa (strain TUFC12733) TaxID=1330018 RepID=A0A167PTG9_CALVF|nr:hypothetical protein CALVIDRAFT_402928 [Calocera viscosa TUFC12733]